LFFPRMLTREEAHAQKGFMRSPSVVNAKGGLGTVLK
jgi:hypothetical protein